MNRTTLTYGGLIALGLIALKRSRDSDQLQMYGPMGSAAKFGGVGGRESYKNMPKALRKEIIELAIPRLAFKFIPGFNAAATKATITIQAVKDGPNSPATYIKNATRQPSVKPGQPGFFTFPVSIVDVAKLFFAREFATPTEEEIDVEIIGQVGSQVSAQQIRTRKLNKAAGKKRKKQIDYIIGLVAAEATKLGRQTPPKAQTQTAMGKGASFMDFEVGGAQSVPQAQTQTAMGKGASFMDFEVGGEQSIPQAQTQTAMGKGASFMDFAVGGQESVPQAQTQTAMGKGASFMDFDLRPVGKYTLPQEPK